jgi:L-seryl-tRNA(Ser) seleniumtransferase
MAREIAHRMRSQIQQDQLMNKSRDVLLSEAVQDLEAFFAHEALAGIRRVINATGVVLHTNLGRAPLSESAKEAVLTAAGYCTVEYDVETGQRGKRAGRVEELLKHLTGAEAALVVNNCAAAALLILSVLARDGETIVSRGELVEIGGDFRVPDVMSNSGTRMVEVGTTNRTHLDDYRKALNERTRLIMRVHPSNYRIVGFTAAPKLDELVVLAHEAKLPIYEDAGSGAIRNLADFGLDDEASVQECLKAGVDVVSFSGDKLLGSAQAGLIVGTAEVITRLRNHSLYRALRADKLCLAALEATLDAHRREAFDEIPALQMLSHSKEAIGKRAADFIQKLSEGTASNVITATTLEGESAVGGGSGANVHPKTVLISIRHQTMSAEEVEKRLRHSSTPVISRIAGDAVLLDLRTVDPREEAELLRALKAL